MKDKIKELLRETFLLEKKKTKKDKDKKEDKKEKSGDEKIDLPPDIEKAFDKENREGEKKPYVTQVSSMKAMGIKNDASTRSEFSKKVNAFTDPTTGYTYKFTEDEIAQLRAILDIS